VTVNSIDKLPAATRTVPVRTIGLTKRFGARTALDGLDLELERGEVFGMVGPNGAGKTTTMRLLLDILRPSAGTVRVLGLDPRAGGAALRRQIGYLPGELRLEGRLSARSLLEHYASISGAVEPAMIEGLAERLGLDLSRQVRKLSKGNKQKVGLIQAFMHRPELLILDEPTSGLDPVVQQEFLTMVREASAEGQTVFLSSHVLSEIDQAADRVGVLHRGKLVKVGGVAGLRRSQRRRVKATLRGSLGRQRSAFSDGLAEPMADPAALAVDAKQSERAAELRARLERLPQAAEVQLRQGDAGVISFSLSLAGEVDPLIKLLAGYEVVDLVVAEPVFEEAVMDLYREEGNKNDA